MKYDICGTCVYIEPKNFREHHTLYRGDWRSYHCKEIGGYHEETDRACKYYEESLKYRKPKCYLTTLAVETLGEAENIHVFNTINNFKEEYVAKMDDYKALLEKYDIVGPILCSDILADPNKIMVINIMMEQYLLPVCELLKNNEYEKAIKHYCSMVKDLVFHYHLSTNKSEEEDIIRLVRTTTINEE